MKNKLLILLSIIIASCSSDDNTPIVEDSFKYKGYYEGTFNRYGNTTTGNGTITFIIDSEGDIEGSYNVEYLSNFSILGTADNSGNVYMHPTSLQINYAAHFEGTISNDTITGTWEDSSRNWEGTWIAVKKYDVY